MEQSNEKKYNLATFGGGCFWCTEAVFLQLKGVELVESGYSGGAVVNPTYEQVCSERTGHAEVIQITYDPALVSYHDLMRVHLLTHDPTTLNQQGNDAGTQYRSIILYRTDAERQTAQDVIAEMQANFDSPIVTELITFETFYRAEDYHQNYYALNSQQPYCHMLIRPKLEKLNGILQANKLA